MRSTFKPIKNISFATGYLRRRETPHSAYKHSVPLIAMLCIKAGIHKGEIVIKKIIKYSAQPEYFHRVFIDQSYFGLWFELFLLYQQKNTMKLTGYISLLFLQKGFVPGLFEEKEIGTGCC